MTSLFLSIVALLFSCNNIDKTNFNEGKLGDGLYAQIETSKGTITLELEYKKTPFTVANFVTLAEGDNDMVTEQYRGKHFYDGLKFHRVIKDFMIQTGDPNGDGSGGPGYNFDDEITDLKHDRAGTLAMANAGPNTNGSQFYITHKAVPHLDGGYTVFGYVVDGQDVVNKIEQGDEMKSVKIIRVGRDAKKFNAKKVFDKGIQEEKEKLAAIEKATKEKMAYFANLKAKGTTTSSGLTYYITQKGNQAQPAQGTEVYIAYSGFVESTGYLFDSSNAETAKTFGNYIPQKDAAHAYKPIPFKVGTKMGMIPGFIEGLEKMAPGDKAVLFIPAHLGYGERGAPRGHIPPNADIIFEIEMLGSMPADSVQQQ